MLLDNSKRRATAYCGVCDKHVILTESGVIAEHKDNDSKLCVGSGEVGTWEPRQK
jgi:hypothetical protein